MSEKIVETNQYVIEFLEQFRSDDLPQEVVHEAKRAVLDTLGCAIAGIDTPLGRRLTALAGRFKARQGTAVLGLAQPVLPMMAAMANGYLANALDADDGHRRSRLHAGGIVIPAALAAAQEAGCSGQRFLEAVIIGYELGLRAGMASTAMETYLGSAMGSTFGAAAAAGRLMSLTPEQTLNAMGVAEMQAPNCMLMGWIESRRIPMVKEGMGWSAASGLMAAAMAQEGITGTLTIFNGREDLAQIDTLGEQFEILKRYYKPCPGCRWTHVPLQTLQRLMTDHHIDTHHIRAIHVRTLSNAFFLDNTAPSNMEEAQYSIPFVLAATLVEGGFGPRQMRPEKLADASILAMARKVCLHEEPSFNQFYPGQILCDVELEMADGQRLSARNEAVHGDHQHPMSDGELEEKFIDLTAERLASEQAGQLMDRIWRIDAEGDINAFIALAQSLIGTQ